MNTNPDLLNLPAPESAAPEVSAPPRPRPGRTRHRRTGKVASLPKTARDKINAGLDDGRRYQDIIDSLGPEGQGLNVHHISEWKDGGYQDYLQDKSWHDEVRARQETFTDLPAGPDALKLPEAGLQLAATGACELLRDLSEPGTDPEGKVDPDEFVRITNSLSRLSRSILTLQQYRDAAAKAKAAIHELKDPKRKLTDSERRAIVRQVDEILGISSEDIDDDDVDIRSDSPAREGSGVGEPISDDGELTNPDSPKTAPDESAAAA
ncbi:MAG TPA: hypothetical protein VNZ64_26950 [Candidatus Acidoferrum sp.]|jgi:hypothetical protein|nr:hypothetical protein [Candidatus Acidoferrum sp.]